MLPPPYSAHILLRVWFISSWGRGERTMRPVLYAFLPAITAGRSGCVFIFSVHPHHPCWFHYRALPTDYSKFRCILILFPLRCSQAMQRADTLSESFFWTHKVTTEHLPRRCPCRGYFFGRNYLGWDPPQYEPTVKRKKKKCMQDKSRKHIFGWDSGKKQDIMNSV